MPDTRGDQQQKDEVAQVVTQEKTGNQRPTVLKRYFPHMACLLVVGGITLLTYHMEQEVSAGRLSPVPYVLLAVLFGSIFAVHYFLHEDD